MNSFKEAMIKEKNKQYVEATLCYEDDIKNNPNASVDSYINLAFIYWGFLACGFDYADDSPIPDGYSVELNSCKKIIELGLKKYPNNVELHFWKKYCYSILGNENISDKYCLDLMEKYGEQNYVPYFFLYVVDREKYEKQRDGLMKEIEKVPTAKNDYIVSVVTAQDERKRSYARIKHKKSKLSIH